VPDFGHHGYRQVAGHAVQGQINRLLAKIGNFPGKHLRVEDGIAADVQQHQARIEGAGQVGSVIQGPVGGLEKIGEDEQRRIHKLAGEKEILSAKNWLVCQ